MDEQSQFRELLNATADYLPQSALITCRSLNEHGEWEIAFAHCKYHLQGVQLPYAVSMMLIACEQRFGLGATQRRPNQSLHRTAFGRR